MVIICRALPPCFVYGLFTILFFQSASCLGENFKSSVSFSNEIHQALKYSELGFPSRALATIEPWTYQAQLPLAEQGYAHYLTGSFYRQLGTFELAHRWLNRAESIYHHLDNSQALAQVANERGILWRIQEHPFNAIKQFEHSIQLANTKNQDPVLILTGRLNLLDSELYDLEYLDQPRLDKKVKDLVQLWSSLEDHLEKAHRGLVLSKQLTTLAKNLPTAPMALDIIGQSLRIAKSVNHDYIAAYLTAQKALLYEQSGQPFDALKLIRHAIGMLQPLNDQQALAFWYGHEGRLLAQQGLLSDAETALKNSVNTLVDIRYGLLGSTQNTFNQQVSPIFYQLADLMLKRSGAIENQYDQQQHYKSIRLTLERLREAQILDYFNDDCFIPPKQLDLEQVMNALGGDQAETVAAIYPVVLKDRIELLVSFPDRFQQFTVKVNEKTLRRWVKTLRRSMDPFFVGAQKINFELSARQLYDILIAPYQDELVKANITTLVFIPSGILSTIPPSVLQDTTGQFLVEKYNVAVVPSIRLTDPQPIKTVKPNLLAVGLSDPGPLEPAFPPLVEVERELDRISTFFPTQTLKNNQFTKQALLDQLVNNDYSMVHIATHGVFGGDPRDSFLLASDGPVNLNEFEQILSQKRFDNQAIELLVLSACQTAAGDERAALGLAGVALKSGAKSALASLWSVDDVSTRLLIEQFYQALAAGYSKAFALRQAQLHLMKESNYSHPKYWAAFVMIGNWQ